MSCRIGNSTMEKARGYVFRDRLPFNVILNYTQPEPNIILVSLMRVLMEYAVMLQELISLGDRNDPNNYNDSFPSDTIFELKYVSIPFNNIQHVTENILTMVTLMNTYMQEQNDSISRIAIFALIGIMVVIPLFYTCIVVYFVKHISSDKMIIDNCLASLPKHVVSHVADGFKVLKKTKTKGT
jgi:hypothetical protein